MDSRAILSVDTDTGMRIMEPTKVGSMSFGPTSNVDLISFFCLEAAELATAGARKLSQSKTKKENQHKPFRAHMPSCWSILTVSYTPKSH